MARVMSFNNRTNKRMIEFNRLLAKLEEALDENRTQSERMYGLKELTESTAKVNAARQELRTFVNLI